MNKRFTLISILIICSLLFACVSAPKPPADSGSTGSTTGSTMEEKAPELPREKELIGGGMSTSLLGSMQAAKAEAVKKGVVEIIGENEEAANHEKLSEVLYDPKYNSGYVELVERTRKTKEGDNYIYEGRFMVQLHAIQSTLRAHGILGDEIETTTDVENLVDSEMETVTSEDIDFSSASYDEPTNDEKRFIARYVDRMTYLVYFDEEAKENREFMKSAVNMANEYLIAQNMQVIDIEQVEKLKEDEKLVFEEETGESVSIIQWIAQKLNADIYIEIYGKTDGRSEMGGKHYGTANVSLKAYDASTGDLAGTASYNLPSNQAMFSKVSLQAAKLAAMQSVIYSKTMPRLIGQVQDKMTKTLVRGIRFEVTIQNPPNDRIMSRFWKKAARGLKSYQLVYQTAEEVKYEVWIIGGAEDLKNVFYDSSESIPDLENMYAVLIRGKSVTFNSGL